MILHPGFLPSARWPTMPKGEVSILYREYIPE